MLVRWLKKFMRLFFRLLYNEFAWTYDVISGIVSVGRWNTWIRTVLPYIGGRRVLELGHGPGHLQYSLLQQDNLQVYGIDLSPFMGRRATRRLRKKGCHPALVNASASRLPYPSGSMDTVVSTFPSEYIGQEETIREAYRVLKSGGRFVIVPGAWITGKSILDRIAALLFRITRQAPEWEDRFTRLWEREGFQTDVEWVEVKRSTVLIIKAEKP
ncbi:MAG: class I SAM-dependent methyltransferase [Chloroflexi bacterium]|nr:MAG: class I SAM-dependent methyltransferase [Chloroflexota bacterium]